MQKGEVNEKKKVPVVQILAGVFAGVLLIIALVLVLAVLPLQNATAEYNSAVEEYNAAAEDYNSMLSLTCVDNLDGFPESAENLDHSGDAASQHQKIPPHLDNHPTDRKPRAE